MVGTRKRSGAVEQGENVDINEKRTRTEEVKVEKMASSPISLRKKALMNSDSDSSRTSRRLSTSDSQEADESKTPVKLRQARGLTEKPDTPLPTTPTRRSIRGLTEKPDTPIPSTLSARRSIRGLGTDAAKDPDTPQTPTKRSKWQMGQESEGDKDEKKEENDGKMTQETTPAVSTPVRRSRRLSGSDLEVSGVQTPTRRGRRSVGPADDKDKNDKSVESKRRRSILKSEEEDDTSDALAIIEEIEEENNDEKLNKEGLETIAENEEDPNKEDKEKASVEKVKPNIKDSDTTQTPIKRSRRSGMECEQASAHSTPLRKSRRLSSSEVDLPAVQTPTRRGRQSVVKSKEDNEASKTTETKIKHSETKIMEAEGDDMKSSIEKEPEEEVESRNKEELQVIVEGEEIPEKKEDNLEKIEEEKIEKLEVEKQEKIEEDKEEMIEEDNEEKVKKIEEDEIGQEKEKDQDDEKEQEDDEMHEPLRLSPPSTPDEKAVSLPNEKAGTNDKTKDKNETPKEQVSSIAEMEEISCSVPDGKITTADDVKEASGNIDTKADGKENMVANVTPPSNKPDAQDNNKEMKKKKKKKKKAKEMTDEDIKKEEIRNIPKGMPVSGRFWKEEKKSFRTTKKSNKGITTSWAKKMQMKQERKEFGSIKKELVEEKQKKREELKRRQELNKTRREENAKKAEVVQVIKDPSKIKKMSKKQLRYIATRDTTVINKSYK